MDKLIRRTDAAKMLGLSPQTLARWEMNKYKRLKNHPRKALHRLGVIARREPSLFYHWKLEARSVQDPVSYNSLILFPLNRPITA